MLGTLGTEVVADLGSVRLEGLAWLVLAVEQAHRVSCTARRAAANTSASSASGGCSSAVC